MVFNAFLELFSLCGVEILCYKPNRKSGEKIMKFQFRGCTSLLVTISFLIMTLSGVILYFAPRGGSTHWTSWIMFGMNKPGWQALHVNICLLFLIVAIIHLIFNWQTFWCYIKKAFCLGFCMKTEMIVALLLAAVVTAGTIYQVPPFSIIKGIGGHGGPSGGRGPGFGQGMGRGQGRMEGVQQGQGQGPGEGQGRQFRGGRGADNPN
jgi:hypothetical protein